MEEYTNGDLQPNLYTEISSKCSSVRENSIISMVSYCSFRMLDFVQMHTRSAAKNRDRAPWGLARELRPHKTLSLLLASRTPHFSISLQPHGFYFSSARASFLLGLGVPWFSVLKTLLWHTPPRSFRFFPSFQIPSTLRILKCTSLAHLYLGFY